MATKLIFVETPSAEKRATLCRWVETFYEAGLHVLMVTDSTLAAQHLDQMLWSFSQPSFIPHRVWTRPGKEPPIEPVLILSGNIFIPGFEVVVVDSHATLEYLDQFATAVIPVLLDDPDQRQESRLLWQTARDKGWPLRHVPCSAGVTPQIPKDFLPSPRDDRR
jgi:DNA polymerase III subunit chi